MDHIRDLEHVENLSDLRVWKEKCQVACYALIFQSSHYEEQGLLELLERVSNVTQRAPVDWFLDEDAITALWRSELDGLQVEMEEFKILKSCTSHRNSFIA